MNNIQRSACETGRALRDWLYAHRVSSRFRVQATGRLEASPVQNGRRNYVLIVDDPVGVKIINPMKPGNGK